MPKRRSPRRVVGVRQTRDDSHLHQLAMRDNKRRFAITDLHGDLEPPVTVVPAKPLGVRSGCKQLSHVRKRLVDLPERMPAYLIDHGCPVQALAKGQYLID